MDTLERMQRPDERLAASTVTTKQVKWTTLLWGLLAFAGLLPIGLLSLYALRLTAQSVRDLVQANNLSAATMTAELVSRDLEHSINLAQAFAALPGMVEAVELRKHDAARAEEEVRARLRTVVQSYPRIDRAGDESGRKAPRAPHGREPHVASEHEVGAVGEIDDTHDAEDEGEAARQKEQERAVGEAVERLRDQELPGHSRSAECAPSAMAPWLVMRGDSTMKLAVDESDAVRRADV